MLHDHQHVIALVFMFASGITSGWQLNEIIRNIRNRRNG